MTTRSIPMDMNAFRKHLAQRAEEQGEDNKPQHRAFGADVDRLTRESRNAEQSSADLDVVNDIQEFVGVDAVDSAKMRGSAVPKRKPGEPMAGMEIHGSEAAAARKSKQAPKRRFKESQTDDESLTGRDIVEAFEIVNFFCESIMEEHGLNEESEDIDAIIEEALNLLDLDEDYGKMPTVSQGLSDDEKKKVQKGEKSQMPTAGVEDKLPGEQQSSIDAIKAVLGSKKGSAATAAY